MRLVMVRDSWEIGIAFTMSSSISLLQSHLSYCAQTFISLASVYEQYVSSFENLRRYISG